MVTITPVVTTSGGHIVGDVVFNLTDIKLPAPACKLVSISGFVANQGTSEGFATSKKLGVLFFKNKINDVIGPLSNSANISSSDFNLNEYIGQSCLHTSQSNLTQVSFSSETKLLYPGSINSDTIGVSDGEHGSVFEPMVLKASGDNMVYAAGVIHAEQTEGRNALTFSNTSDLKINFHFEY